mmetsp:Transcript_75713/g.126076  ORF Transcript_75713/g.126076 Transcript_75713/m.126076 type:complete len:104 (+) Transcript_75713:525-836(+)
MNKHIALGQQGLSSHMQGEEGGNIPFQYPSHALVGAHVWHVPPLQGKKGNPRAANAKRHLTSEACEVMKKQINRKPQLCACIYDVPTLLIYFSDIITCRLLAL